MAFLSRPYSDTVKADRTLEPRARRGGPRRPQSRPTHYERLTQTGTASSMGSHMPLDTGIHWEWRNPLNLLPAFLLVLVLIGLIAMVGL